MKSLLKSTSYQNSMSTHATILAIEPGTFTGMSGKPITFSADVIKRCAESFLGKPVKRHHRGEMKFAAGREIGDIHSSKVNELGQNYQQIKVIEPVKEGDGVSVEVLTMTDLEGNVLAFAGEGVAVVDRPACPTCRVTKVGLSKMTTEQELMEQLAAVKASNTNLQTQHAEALAEFKKREDAFLAEIDSLKTTVNDQSCAIKKLGEALASFRVKELDSIVEQIKLRDKEFDADKWISETFGAELEDLEVKKKVLTAYLKGSQKETRVSMSSGAPLGAGTSAGAYSDIFKAAGLSPTQQAMAAQFMSQETYR